MKTPLARSGYKIETAKAVGTWRARIILVRALLF